MNSKQMDLILKAVALAMGVVTIVLSLLGTMSAQTVGILLGIGVAALALVLLR